jgi:hypothetical protein
VLALKTALVLATLAVAISACGPDRPSGWESVEIPMPADAPRVTYQRKPFSDVGFVGTEQSRRLRVNDSLLVKLSVQPSLTFRDNVYLQSDSSGYHLYFEEAHAVALVNLSALSMSEERPDSLGTFLGVVGGNPELHFVPASEGAPEDFD